MCHKLTVFNCYMFSVDKYNIQYMYILTKISFVWYKTKSGKRVVVDYAAKLFQVDKVHLFLRITIFTCNQGKYIFIFNQVKYIHILAMRQILVESGKIKDEVRREEDLCCNDLPSEVACFENQN